MITLSLKTFNKKCEYMPLDCHKMGALKQTLGPTDLYLQLQCVCNVEQ